MIGCFVMRSDMAGGTISVWIFGYRLLGDTLDFKEFITWEVLSFYLAVMSTFSQWPLHSL
jgi:hypothetical protein